MTELYKLEIQGGLNNKSQSLILKPPFVAAATNLDFADNGELRLRSGCVKKASGTLCHSVYQVRKDRVLFVANGNLKQYEPSSDTVTTLKTGIGHGQVSYSSGAGRIYLANGAGTYVISGGACVSLGVPPPPFQPTLKATPAGGLYAGTYQVALTWFRGDEESGTGQAAEIAVGDGGGIALSDLPTPASEITLLGVYCSSVNSKELYLVGQFAANKTALNIGYQQSNLPLLTQFGFPAPPFNLICCHQGRVYGAQDQLVWLSDPLNPGLFRGHHFLLFGSAVKLLLSLPGALYVVADRTYRLTNLDGDDMPQKQEVAPYSAVSGACAKDLTQTQAVWMSDKGYVLATSEKVELLAYDRISVDNYRSGAITILEQDGCKRVVGTFLK